MYRFDKQELISLARPGFARTRTVRFQEVDAAGIIFYPVVLEYCHDVYVELLDKHGTPLAKALEQREWAAPIRHAEADYFVPLRFGDVIEVSLALAHVEPTEVTLGFRVVLSATGTVTAVAQTVHTFVALPGFKRCEIPEAVRTALRDVEQ
jgi:YbgC/YbaW family acyl-CoA thioester hydrolase